jgi:hypothetical protein
MAAVVSLAKEYEDREHQSGHGDSRPGVLLARELFDGTGVVTGTRIRLEDDPRTEYGALYRSAAVWIARQHEAKPELMPSVVPEKQGDPAGAKIQDWLRDIFSAAAGWRVASALATVAIGFLIVLNMEVTKEPMSPSSAQTTPAFKYISTGEIQELKTQSPDQLIKEITDRFIGIGGFPETRKSGSQMFSLYIATAGLEREKLLAILAEYRLNLPEDGVLRVDVIQEEGR